MHATITYYIHNYIIDIYIQPSYIYSIVSAQHKLPWAAAVWRPPHSPPRPPKRETERERQ